VPSLRLLIVDGSVARTGALQCARQMSSELQEVATCELVLPIGSLPPISDCSHFKEVHYLPLCNPGRSIGSFSFWIASLLRSSVELRFLLHRRTATHLVLNDWYLLQGILCRLLGYRGVILTWVRLDPLRFGRWPAAILFRLIALTSTDLVVVSRYVQRRLPPGVVSTLLYDSLPQPPLPAVPPQGQRLVYVGNYTPGKGQDLAIEAFARIAPCHPQATLEFYGGTMGRIGNTRWRSELQTRAAALGLSDRIHFHDFASDPRQVLQGAYAALNCSKAESFSLTVLEASAAGLPVIATACGGPAEIIEHGKTGLLIPLGSIEAAAGAINMLLCHPHRARLMGAGGAERVERKFSVQSFRSNLLAVLY
jgi:glycosyltransferase involved in cell wall biosynthesis